MASSEADEETEDTGALAAVGCLRAISTILESISSLPHLYIQIEPTLLPILRKMLTSDGQGIVLYCIVLYCLIIIAETFTLAVIIRGSVAKGPLA
jgi:hypothetical protein